MSYLDRFRNPKFLNQTGAKMPNTGNWQDRHLAAIRIPHGSEIAIVAMIEAWARYADNHQARYESGIGEDGVLGEAWKTLGESIRALLNGECGRLDCGTLDGFLCDTLAAEGFEQ